MKPPLVGAASVAGSADVARHGWASESWSGGYAMAPDTAAQTMEAIRERFANADAFITNYGDRQESALFAEAKFLLAELDKVAAEARREALTEAWQAVDRAVRPLGTECGQSRWNAGYTQARDEAQNAILALRDEVKS